MKKLLLSLLAVPVCALAQGAPDIQLTSGFDMGNVHKTAIEPTTFNHVIIDELTPAATPAYYQVRTNMLVPTSSSNMVQIPKGTSSSIFVEVSRNGQNVAFHLGSATAGVRFSTDRGATFQTYPLQVVSPYTICTSPAMKFGPNDLLYADYFCRKSLSVTNPVDGLQLRRMIIDQAGVATDQVVTNASGTITRSLQLAVTDRYVVTHFSPGPSYANVSIGTYTDVPAVAVTDTQTNITSIRHVGKPPPSGGNFGAYNIGNSGGGGTRMHLASDGKSIFLANPVPLTNGHTNQWRVWQFPENGGDFFPNTVTQPSFPPIHDLSLRTDGTDINAYMTLTQTQTLAGLLHGLIAPYDPSGNNTTVRMAYLTPDQVSTVYPSCTRIAIQVVNLVNPNAGAYGMPVVELQDFPACWIEAALGWGVGFNSAPLYTGYYQLPGGFLTSYGVALGIPGLPAYTIHFADLTP